MCEKDTQENTEGQISGGEKQSRVKFSAAKEREAAMDGFLSSSLQAQAKLSWNKRGMTLLMKGRELTRIALAQCTRSFCQSRLQRFNKVHGYNEAWAHLSLNCAESLPWSVFFSALAHPSRLCTRYFGDDCNCSMARESGSFRRHIRSRFARKYKTTTAGNKSPPSLSFLCLSHISICR